MPILDSYQAIMNRSLYILLCCISVSLQTQAQTAANNLLFEKVYIHTDREHYAAGEDIWFKAYLVNAQLNTLINSSNNLYVELISTEAKIAERKVIRLDQGLGHGDFHLGDSIQGGTYSLRAYTNWMRNFGEKFIFEKEIQVYNTIKLPTTG